MRKKMRGIYDNNISAVAITDHLVIDEVRLSHLSAVWFDALMYGMGLANLVDKKYSRARSNLYKRVSGIANVANIP